MLGLYIMSYIAAPVLCDILCHTLELNIIPYFLHYFYLPLVLCGCSILHTGEFPTGKHFLGGIFCRNFTIGDNLLGSYSAKGEGGFSGGILRWGVFHGGEISLAT